MLQKTDKKDKIHIAAATHKQSEFFHVMMIFFVLRKCRVSEIFDFWCCLALLIPVCEFQISSELKKTRSW